MIFRQRKKNKKNDEMFKTGFIGMMEGYPNVGKNTGASAKWRDHMCVRSIRLKQARIFNVQHGNAAASAAPLFDALRAFVFASQVRFITGLT